MSREAGGTTVAAPPFDRARLEAEMKKSGIDLIVATSPHNVRYLSGGYENYFFGSEPALGLSRYQPILGYPVGRPEQAFFVGNQLDRDNVEVSPLWVERRYLETVDTVAAANAVVEAVHGLDLDSATIGVEMPFLAADSYEVLRRSLPQATLVDATPLMDEMRTIKGPIELDAMRRGSAAVVESMQAVFARLEVGMTSTDLSAALAREERARGLEFDYCHVAIGNDFNRAPSSRQVEAGVPICLDSGGELDGYIADLARMACIGEPSDELRRALGEVDAVQHAAWAEIRPGNLGGRVFEAAEATIGECEFGEWMAFLPHGLGLVNHEGPRIVPPRGNPHSYPSDHVERPFEPGMVISIEAFITHPTIGFVKLEDTLAVTAEGHELFGPGGRNWTVVG